jgi:hypothetical protein
VAAASGGAGACHDLVHDVSRRGVVDRLGGIETQPVDVELVDPVRGVRQEELADGAGVVAVEVDGLAPLVRVAIREVVRRVRLEIVAVRAQVVVDDVQDHAQSEPVCAIHEGPQIVGRAVEPTRREEIDAVVAPPESAGKLGHRHHLDERDAGPRQLRKLVDRRRPRPRRRERTDMQLVDDLSGQTHPGPALVAPGECRRVDDLRRAVRTFRLRPRCRVRDRGAAVEGEAVTGARHQLPNEAGEIATILSRQGREARVRHDIDTRGAGRPYAKMDPPLEHLGADRETPAGDPRARIDDRLRRRHRSQ